MPGSLNPFCAEFLLKSALCLYGIGILGSLLCLRREKTANLIAFGGAGLASLCGIMAAVFALAGWPAPGEVAFELGPSVLPYVSLGVSVDALSAFFLLIVSSLGLALSIYSLGYNRGWFGRKSVGALGAFYNALLLATTLVFTAQNAFFFLIAWEIMALAAYCLVSFEHEQEETRRAGVLYFVMSHIGTGFLILGFLLLFQASGGYGFAGFHGLGATMPDGRSEEHTSELQSPL
jgi:hydrogenase-4 component B